MKNICLRPRTPGILPHQQPRYQPVRDFTYWPMLGSFNNSNKIIFYHSAISSDSFEEINQALLDDISEIMASLVKYGNYVAMNTTYSTTMGYYVINFVSEAYTLQEDTTRDGKTSLSG